VLERSSAAFARPERDLVSALTEVPLSVRSAMLEGPFDAENHRRHCANLPCLHQIEVGGEVVRREADELCVAVWNVERLRSAKSASELLLPNRPDVALLSEVDKGMVRSGNRHGLAELAERLGHQYAYGVEFIELGLGETGEVPPGTWEENALGFHGNAVTSALPLQRPFLIRLDSDGGWYGPERGQQRVGGRLAVGAEIALAKTLVTIVSVHLESNSNPDDRALQVSRLLHGLNEYSPAPGILIGGDFNTSTIDRRRGRDDDFRRFELTSYPRRLIEVEPYEPLFALMAEEGFDWSACNLMIPTERPQPGAAPRPRGKIDWIFTRGLRVTRPAVVPAEDANGTQISDHDCLFVNVVG
jgi:endonuclease/exonuclease/phosphatase family metal-dependent hydrolase